MGFPPVIVECAFDNVDDETLYTTGGWSEITPWVRRISGFLRGRNYETNRSEAGTVEVDLDNIDLRFTPNQLSPYWPNIIPNRRFRIRGKNMVGANIARGGGAEHDATLFYESWFLGASTRTGVSDLRWATHTANGAPVNDHLETTVYAGQTGERHIVIWYAPVETATRLTHSAYVWKVSGTEPTNTTISLKLYYYDNNDVEMLADLPPVASVTGTPTSPQRLAVSHAPFSSTKYCFAVISVYYPTATTNDITYAFTGAQTELPANLAPNISAQWDVMHWQVLQGSTPVPLNANPYFETSDFSEGFEQGVTGWTPTNGTFAVTTAVYHSGAQAGRLTTTGTPTQAYVRYERAVVGGSAYSVSMWVMSAAGYSSVNAAIDWYTSAHAYISTTNIPGVAIAAGVWTLLAIDGTAPTNAAYAQFGPTLGANPPTGTLLNLDDVDWGVSGWIPTGGTFIRSQTMAHQGVASGLLTPDGTSATAQVANTTAGGAPASPGLTYSLDAYVLTAVSRNISAGITWQTVGGSWIAESMATFTLAANTWTRVKLSDVAPATTGKAVAIFRETGTPPSSNTLRIDEAMIIADSTPVRHSATNSVEVAWANAITLYQRIPHMIPGEIYSVAVEVFKTGVGPNILLTADDGMSGATLSVEDTWTTLNLTFEATETHQDLKFIPQGITGPGDIIRVRGLRVEHVDNSSLTIANGTDTCATTWERPLDIYEGWVEEWPWAIQGGISTITVADRLSRISGIELANTLPEALDTDDPDIVIPFSDDIGSTSLMWSGNWALAAKLGTIPLATTRGDLGTSAVTFGVQGSSDESAALFSPVSGNYVGYFVEIPYDKIIDTPPTAPPAPTPEPPPPSKTTYTRTWNATWSRSYNGNTLGTRWDDSAHMYQGSYDGSSGNQRALAGFNYLDMMAWLNGAEIIDVTFTLTNLHWRWNAGGTVRIGTHLYEAKASTWNPDLIFTPRWDVFFKEGQTLSFSVGSGVGYEIQRGWTKGLSVGPGLGGADPNDDYGFFAGATEGGRPAITITFRK